MRPNVSINISSADASDDAEGEALDASQVLYLSAQAVVTGTSTGTLNIQASNDIVSPTHWSDIETLGTVEIAGAGVYLIPSFQVGYRWVRSFFVKDNGDAGTLTVRINTQGF